MATSIWQKAGDVLGFNTAIDTLRSFFTGDFKDFIKKSGPGAVIDVINRVKGWDNTSDESSNNSATTVATNGPLVNADGSSNLGNITSLEQLGPMLTEAVVGAIPEIQRQWSSAENQKARDFEYDLSSTAYQRAVNDMKAAGINPILAYSQGGASTPGASVVGASNSGSSVGSTLQGINSLLKTVLSEDRMSDAQADKSALAALKYTDSHSATQAYNDYLKYKTTVDQTKASAYANEAWSKANWYDRH